MGVAFKGRAAPAWTGTCTPASVRSDSMFAVACSSETLPKTVVTARRHDPGGDQHQQRLRVVHAAIGIKDQGIHSGGLSGGINSGPEGAIGFRIDGADRGAILT